jgi:hypothetical protein
MAVTFKIESGPRAGATYLIQPGQTLSVGRTNQATLPIPEDTFLSRVHFEVTFDGRICRLRDLNSSNGTKHNGASVREAQLLDGDQIHAGQTLFSVVIPRLSEPPPRPPILEYTAPPPLPPAPPLPPPPPEPIAEPDPPSDPVADRERLLITLRGPLQPLYAVLDTAIDPDVLKVLIESRAEYAWLFQGQDAYRLAHFAPYLAPLPPHSPLLPLLVEQGWGKNWGIFFTSDRPPQELVAFLRRFMVVQLPAGDAAMLRFYDPRVLRALLPTCTREQLAQIFSVARFFMMEAEEPAAAVGFSVTERGYQMQESPLSGLKASKSALIENKPPVQTYPPPPPIPPPPGLLRLTTTQQTALGKVKRNAFELAMVEHIKDTFPDYFAAVGPEAVAELVHYGANRPQRYGIRGQLDIRRYLQLMVILGRDFDVDPAFPWSASILTKRLKPNEKLAQLEAEAHRHLLVLKAKRDAR